MSAIATVRGLGPAPRRLLLAAGLNNFGTGLVLPVLVAYVNLVNGLDVRVATTAVAITSVGAAVGGPLLGLLADRIGRRPAITLALATSTAGTLAFSAADRPEHFFAAAALLGLGLGGNAVWSTVLAESVGADRRAQVFGLNMLVINASIGAGGLVSGVVVHSLAEAAFRGLYLANAATFVLALLVLRTVLRGERRTPRAAATAPSTSPPTSPRAYLALLRDRRLAPAWAVVIMVFALGFSQLEAGIPALLVGGRHVTPTQLAIAFGINTVAVIIIQLGFQDRLARWRVRPAVTAALLCWVLTWALVLVAAAVDSRLVAFAALAAALVIFALGECLFGVTVPPMINSVVDSGRRGTANGLYAVMTSIGFFAGPLLSGELVSRGSSAVLPVAMVLGCAAAVLITRLGLPAVAVADLTAEAGQPAPTREPEPVR